MPERRYRLLSLILVTLCFVLTAEPNRRPKVTEEELSQALVKKMGEVPEFRFIREKAAELGIKVYLQGGSATALAFHTARELKRSAGDDRYQAAPRDSDFDSIFWPGQDIDIVADPGGTKLNALAQAIQERFPYTENGKSLWDFHALRSEFAGRPALLNNPDFLSMHQDSLSLGAIEITEGKKGPRVRELQNWDQGAPQFLKDVIDEKITLLPSKDHAKTARAAGGKNPPLFAAIRYLNKVAQYGLKPNPGHLETVKSWIAAFSPTKDMGDEYIAYWLKRNAPKMFERSTDLAQMQKLARDLGLAAKLKKVLPQLETGSFAWWLAKEPLASKKVGQGRGKTAEELGLTRLIHATNNLSAFRALSNAADGRPNALISRKGRGDLGEAADYGDGHYVSNKAERDPWRGAYQLEYELDPKARQGSDFEGEGGVIRILNRNAVRIIPNSQVKDPAALLKLILSTPTFQRGTLANESSTLSRWLARAPHEERVKLTKPIFDRIDELVKLPNSAEELATLAWDLKQLGLLDSPGILGRLFGVEVSAPRLIQLLLETIREPSWANHPEAIAAVEMTLFRQDAQFSDLKAVLDQAHWKEHPEAKRWLSHMMRDRYFHHYLLTSHLGNEEWSKDPEAVDWVFDIARKGDSSIQQTLMLRVLSRNYWREHPRGEELFWLTVDKGVTEFELNGLLHNQPSWRTVIEKGRPQPCRYEGWVQ